MRLLKFIYKVVTLETHYKRQAEGWKRISGQWQNNYEELKKLYEAGFLCPKCTREAKEEKEHIGYTNED